jgi:solute carrier family 45 protein 1/2/4
MQKRRSKTGGGTVLGIHNLSIVAPQFFVALVAAGIFRILDGNGKKTIPGEGEGMGSNDVVWVLR